MTASQGDSTSTTVTPIGQAAALVALAITFSVLASVVVCLRVYVRVTIRRFGADDWLMCIGWVSLPQPTKRRPLPPFFHFHRRSITYCWLENIRSWPSYIMPS